MTPNHCRFGAVFNFHKGYLAMTMIKAVDVEIFRELKDLKEENSALRKAVILERIGPTRKAFANCRHIYHLSIENLSESEFPEEIFMLCQHAANIMAVIATDLGGIDETDWEEEGFGNSDFELGEENPFMIAKRLSEHAQELQSIADYFETLNYGGSLGSARVLSWVVVELIERVIALLQDQKVPAAA